MCPAPLKEPDRNAHSATPIAVGLLAIAACGLVLRLHHLNYQSLSEDEISSCYIASQRLQKIGPYLIKDSLIGPLYNLTLHWWLSIVGFGAYQARLLSVILGELTIPATFWIGNELFGRGAGIIAALLMAISQVAVMYSQDARPYALLLMLVTCATYFFVVALHSGRAAPWWGFVCTAILAIYTHYYGAFAIGALLVYAIICRRRYRIPAARWWGAALAAAVLYVPWLTSGVVSEWIRSPKVTGSAWKWNLVHWFSFATSLNTFNNGRPKGLLEESPWWSFLLGGFLFTLPAFIALMPMLRHSEKSAEQVRHRDNLLLLFLLFTIPFALALGVAAVTGQYQIRYILFLATPYYLLVAEGLASFRILAIRIALLLACLIYSAHALRGNFSPPYTTDFRSAYSYMLQSSRPGDCFVLPTPQGSSVEAITEWGWRFYHPNQPQLQILPLDSVLSGSQNCRRVWLISPIYRDNELVRNDRDRARKALAQSYAMAEAKQFHWMDLDLYSPR
jgi:uncharacterized membrane protein